jgi:2-desacetyl-2-hydroxyethyl bacteriochlorophyllide A dehydrogenase
MKAAVFHGGKDIRVEEVPVPKPGPNEVLIDVAAAGICGSDLHYYHGADPWRSAAAGPRRAGHELAGVVVEAGRGVTGVQVGQRVAVEPMHLLGCGRCRQCRRGLYHLCPARGLRENKRYASAGFSEYDIAIAENVFQVPDSLSFDLASMIDVYACSVHAIHRIPVEAANAVVIIGTGPIGMSVGQVARSAGTRKIIMIGRRGESLSKAVEAGATDLTINSSDAPDVAERVRDLTDGEGADIVFETVGGSRQSLDDAVDVAAYGGAIGILGAFWSDVSVAYYKANRKEISLHWCSSYSSWRGVREYQVALDLVAGGRVLASPLITHAYSLERIAEAFAAAADKKTSGAIKVVIHP